MKFFGYTKIGSLSEAATKKLYYSKDCNGVVLEIRRFKDKKILFIVFY